MIGQAVSLARLDLRDIGLVGGVAPQKLPGGGLGVAEPTLRRNARSGHAVVCMGHTVLRHTSD
ncbi:hypothetical protein DDF62_06940 [Caulobacter radicis]|nr:hypothetical protein DDF62_06940 [Caulobacter radicis]